MNSVSAEFPAKMPGRRTRRRILIAVAVVLLPVLYLLAWGPVAWIYGRYPASRGAIMFAAKPINYAYDRGVFRCLGVEDALKSYVNWWQEMGEKE
jgi:hypothetical protein